MAQFSEAEIELSVYGADKLARLAAKLKAEGERDLRLRMMKALRESGSDVKGKVQQAALALPAEKYETGLRQEMAANIAIRTRTTGDTAGVRVSLQASKLGDKRRLPRLMNKGKWSHPVYGNRERWVRQTIRPGFWSGTISIFAPQVRRKMIAVLDETARQLGE